MWYRAKWVFSMMLFSWAPPTSDAIKKDEEHEAEYADTEECQKEDASSFKGMLSDWQKAEPLGLQLSQCWHESSGHSGKTQVRGLRLALSLLRCLRSGLVLGGLIELAAMLTAAIPPIILRWLLVALADPTTNPDPATSSSTQDAHKPHAIRISHSYTLVATMAATQMTAGILINASRYRLEGVGAQAKAALTYMIMNKAFLAPPSSSATNVVRSPHDRNKDGPEPTWNSGAVFNLASVEASRIEDCISGINAIWTVPASFLLAIPMLATNVDASSLGGMVVLLLGLPIFTRVSLRIWDEQKALSGFCRHRAACTLQVIQGIRGIKLAGCRALLEAACALLPTLASMASLILYDTLHEGVPDPAKAFSSFALFLALKPHVNRAAQAAVQLQDLLVGCRAIEMWLETEEPHEMRTTSAEWAVDAAQNTVLSWPARSSADEFLLSFNNKFQIMNGELVAVCGRPGSGKSSLMHAIASQMCLETGSFELGIGSKAALASQTPWIRQGTIRSNIIFDQKFDEAKYWKVINACALIADLERMPRRDLTVVGAGGQGLSSGQAQRVNIARAMYSNADIVLVDDCLRNLDPSTSKTVFEYGLCGLAKDRTRFVATNQAWVARQCDRILWLEDGKATWLTSSGKLDDYFPSLMGEEPVENSSTHRQEAQSSPRQTATKASNADSRSTSESLPFHEDTKRRDSFQFYLGLSGGPKAALVAGGIVFSWQVTAAAVVLWLSLWTSDRFGLSGFASVTLFAIFGFGEALLALWERSVRRVVAAPMGFFQDSLLGSIMDRLSKDADTTDRELIEATRNATLHLARLLGGVALMLTMEFKLLVVVLPGLSAVVAMMHRYAPRLKTVRCREAELRAHVNAAFSEGVDGSSSISVYQIESSARSILVQRLNEWSNVRLLAAANLRWLEVRLDATVATTIGLTGALVVASSASLSPSTVGLIMSQALVLPASLRQGMRFCTSAFQSMVAVERLSSYASSIPREGETESGSMYRTAYDASWPASGDLAFRNVSFSHRQEPGKETPTALRDLSFSIPSGMHVAVVGPTGAGKSTLVSLLLRLLDPATGTINLDSVSMIGVPLHVLRSHIAAVPHDAVLLPNSTIREMADPNHSHSPLAISRLLSDLDVLAGLQNEPPMELDTIAGEQVAQGTGRAQLLALAAVLLNKPRVCVLDETLGCLNVQADANVTEMARDVLKGRTMVAVTHRMRVAMLFDRVLVLDEGGVQAYGTHSDVWKSSQFFREACSRDCITAEGVHQARV
ncbi:oligomycin resistance atp-dependent permease [Colletotrichum asianum]|uniref:Oligomycin resistance atp-dependent permease n=1 Tax=Colletotrichum asianum TaxID=702518 RepID=A0A8H3W5V8_9PEZI|nr:oligomycin resistance atp-dependent permease [Colletotrichum asianum]